MGKLTICIGENKDAFVFATRIVQFLLYLNPKFQDSSSFLCLYRPVCVGPVRKPHCWFSHEAAQIICAQILKLVLMRSHKLAHNERACVQPMKIPIGRCSLYKRTALINPVSIFITTDNWRFSIRKKASIN